MSDTRTLPIIIAGAGATGLTMALSLAKMGHAVTLIGKPDVRVTGRAVSMLEGTKLLLRNIGAWDVLEAHIGPLATLRIIDDTGSLFRAPPASFQARELGLQAFGSNIENWKLVKILSEAATASPMIHFIEDHVQSYDFKPDYVQIYLENGGELRSKLVVAADGFKSAAREAGQIALKQWIYPQTALTALLTHALPHNDISTEFHTRQGPFTTVAMAPSQTAANRSSLVWMMLPARAEQLSKLTPEALAREIERQGQSYLGKITLETPPHLVPMCGFTAEKLTAPRLALIGEAAHVFPPIGAQGLNLGMRDVAHLADLIGTAINSNQDPGGDALLEAYDHSRKADIKLRTNCVDLFNRSLLSEFLAVDVLRGAGMLALTNLAPLRRLVMSSGVMPRGTPPRLMREPAQVNS